MLEVTVVAWLCANNCHFIRMLRLESAENYREFVRSGEDRFFDQIGFLSELGESDQRALPEKQEYVMTISKTSAVVATAVMLAGPAFAGGLNEPVAAPPVQTVPVAPAPVVSYGADWTGGYVGGSLGYADLEGSSTFGDDFNGGGVGLHAGYNYDLGTWVVGGELEYAAYDVTDDTTGQDLDSVFRAKARAGYDAGAFLPFVTLGLAQASTSGALGDLSSDGYLYGVGAEYRVSDAITVGGELLRHEFDDFDSTGIDVNADTAALRVSYNF